MFDMSTCQRECQGKIAMWPGVVKVEAVNQGRPGGGGGGVQRCALGNAFSSLFSDAS